ncbi:MAG: LysR family transcriptional regulator [Thermodesulfobacteriota bacterium]
MDISLLRVFKAVADEESVSGAAERLNYVQPNVTARVRQLENELETPLFYRRNKGMTLTPAGKVLLEYADRALRLMKEAEMAVRDTGRVTGPLSIGSTESAAAVRLPLVLTQYHRQYPDVEITLSTGLSDKLIEEVLDYKLDGAFVSGLLGHSDIEQIEIVTEELVVVTETKVESLEAIENPTLLVFPAGCSYRAVLENWLRLKGIVPYKVMELRTLDGILGCVAAGMGITISPLSVITHLNYAGSVNMHKIAEPFGALPTLFIRRKNAVETRAIKAFIQLAQDLYGGSGLSQTAVPENHDEKSENRRGSGGLRG